MKKSLRINGLFALASLLLFSCEPSVSTAECIVWDKLTPIGTTFDRTEVAMPYFGDAAFRIETYYAKTPSNASKADEWARLTAELGTITFLDPLRDVSQLSIIYDGTLTFDFAETADFAEFSRVDIESGTIAFDCSSLFPYFRISNLSEDAAFIESITLYQGTADAVEFSLYSEESSEDTDDYEPVYGIDYRIDVDEVTDGSDAPVYDVSKANDGTYTATVNHTISEDMDCLTYQDVCDYYLAYRHNPPNYFDIDTERAQAMAYGKAGRLVSTYYYSGGYGYTKSLGTFNNSHGAYLEFDIDITGYYNDGTKITRGAGRVVVVVDGIAQYGSTPLCCFTKNHYSTFYEYRNFYAAWSEEFDASTSYSYRSFASTVDITVS